MEIEKVKEKIGEEWVTVIKVHYFPFNIMIKVLRPQPSLELLLASPPVTFHCLSLLLLWTYVTWNTGKQSLEWIFATNASWFEIEKKSSPLTPILQRSWDPLPLGARFPLPPTPLHASCRCMFTNLFVSRNLTEIYFDFVLFLCSPYRGTERIRK